ncbi:MAG: methyltransferase domain-containing protein [Planctomycetes bacterium]|nr:methyltransferase domain-containing protein [Planctomycetota bacterium]
MTDHAFWQGHYVRGETDWDKGGPAPPLVSLAARGVLRGRSLVVVGCGYGHDALHFARLGYEVTGLDLVEEAVAGADARAQTAAVSCRFVRADVLDPPVAFHGRFDLWLEHTFYCAIDPARRDDYVKAAHLLLRPGGTLFGLFYHHGRAGGPPFDTDEGDLRRRFPPCFELESVERPVDSFPSRAGAELLVRMRRSP